MELKQLSFPKKVRLVLSQPAIMCSGRTKVNCFYRGKIVSETKDEYLVEFKSYGIEQQVLFGKEYGFCLTEGWQDLEIENFANIRAGG
jgi:hypothetical protein